MDKKKDKSQKGGLIMLFMILLQKLLENWAFEKCILLTIIFPLVCLYFKVRWWLCILIYILLFLFYWFIQIVKILNSDYIARSYILSIIFTVL